MTKNYGELLVQLLSLLVCPSLKFEVIPEGPAEALVHVPVLKPGSLKASLPAIWGDPCPARLLTEMEQLPPLEDAVIGPTVC